MICKKKIKRNELSGYIEKKFVSYIHKLAVSLNQQYTKIK